MRRLPHAILVMLVVALAAPLFAGSKREEAQKAMKTLATAKKAEDRASAAEKLGSLGATDAVPALAAALRDPADPVRASAAYALWELRKSAEGSQAAIKAALAEETNNRTILSEIATLDSLGVDMKELAPALEGPLRDPEFEVRLDAAQRAVDHLPAVRLLPIAMEGIAEGSPKISESLELLTALRETGDRALVPAMVEATKRGDRGQVKAAAQNLVFFEPRPPEAFPLLLRLLAHPDPDVRRSAAGDLSRYEAAGQPAVPNLIRLLEDPSDDVREASVQTIDVVGNYTKPQVSAIPALIKAFETTQKTEVRGAIASLLRRMGPAAKAAIPALTKESDSPDPSLRHSVRAALSDIQPAH